jgi:phosphoserine phosphatase
MQVVTLVAAPGVPLADAAVAAVREAIAVAGAGVRVGDPDWLAPATACDLTIGGMAAEAAEQAARAVVGDAPVDVAVQPAGGRRKRLLVADMDSTIVTGETLDELATLAGVGERVVPITRRAMNGEIGFEQALRERVALLEGHSAALLDRALAGVRLTPGARALVRTMRAHGAYCLLISGGFHVFADPVAERCGFHAAEANRLIVRDGVLTGEAGDPIVGKERKLAALREHTARLGLETAATLAVGDGANDLPMLLAAGLGVAFHAKPVVRAQAAARVDHGDLTTLLFYQGYRQAEFAADDAAP